MNNINLISFNVNSLFTIILVDGAIEPVRKALGHSDEKQLPVRMADYVYRMTMCVGFGPFIFITEDHLQHESNISAVMALSLIEFPEKNHQYSRLIMSNQLVPLCGRSGSFQYRVPAAAVSVLTMVRQAKSKGLMNTV